MALAAELDEREVQTLELVVGELVAAAYDARLEAPVVVSIQSFPRLHSIRVRGATASMLQEDPFHLRERVLQQLTLAFGQRRNPDGTTDIWAEVPRAPK